MDHTNAKQLYFAGQRVNTLWGARPAYRLCSLPTQYKVSICLRFRYMPDFLHHLPPVHPQWFCSVCKVKCIYKYGENDVYSSDHVTGKKRKMLYCNDVKTWGLVFSIVVRQELKHVKPSPSSIPTKLVSSLGNTKNFSANTRETYTEVRNEIVSPFFFTKSSGTVYLQYKHSNDFQATAGFFYQQLPQLS